MPTYEYKCPKCGEFEVTQRITENALKKCPTCKSKVERLLSRTSFILKGTGWYATDYAKPSGDAAAKSETPKADSAKTESSTSDSSKSDSSSKAESSSAGNGKSAATASTPASTSKSSSDKSSASKAAD